MKRPNGRPKKGTHERIMADMARMVFGGEQGVLDRVVKLQAAKVEKERKVVRGRAGRAPERRPTIAPTPVPVRNANQVPYHQVAMWNMKPGRTVRLVDLGACFEGNDGRLYRSLDWTLRAGYSLGLFEHRRPQPKSPGWHEWWLTADGVPWWEIVNRNRLWRFRSLNTVWQWKNHRGFSEQERMVLWLAKAVPFTAHERSRKWCQLPKGFVVEDVLWIPEHLRGEPLLSQTRRLSDRFVD